MRRFLILMSICVGLAAGGCGGTGAGADGPGALATTTAIQRTVDEQLAESRETAVAWMTEAPAGSPNEPPDTAGEYEPARISGQIDYPAADLPPMRVVAFNVDSNEYYSVEKKNDPNYAIEDLPPGNYQVVAYLMAAPGFQEGQAGGYTQAVLCGLTAECDDHSLIILELEAGEAAAEVNPGDWRAPVGSLPPDPTR